MALSGVREDIFSQEIRNTPILTVPYSMRVGISVNLKTLFLNSFSGSFHLVIINVKHIIYKLLNMEKIRSSEYMHIPVYRTFQQLTATQN